MWLLFGLLVGLMGIIGISHLRFIQRVNREIDDLFAQQNAPSVDEDHLPELVKHYLAYAYPDGRMNTRCVRLKQTGTLRLSADQPWKPFSAEQYFTLNPAAFVWRAKMTMLPLLWVMTRDRYMRREGNMLIKLLSTLTIADAKGEKIDSGALIRFVAEMMWFPAMFADSRVQWEAIDAHTAKACVDDGGMKGSVYFHFEADGRIEKIVSYERYKDAADGEPTPWYGYVRKYAEFDGVRVPSEVEVGWAPETGYYSWLKLTVTDLEFGVPERYVRR